MTMKPVIIRDQVNEATKNQSGQPNRELSSGRLLCDSFSKESHNKNVISIDEFADIAFNQLPSWIILLLIVRNSLIKPFGLDTNRRVTDIKCEKSQHEIIFGMSDKHLTFYVSLWCKDRVEKEVNVHLPKKKSIPELRN